MRQGGKGSQTSSGVGFCPDEQEERGLSWKARGLRVRCEPLVCHPCSADRAAFHPLDAESQGSVYILSEIIWAFFFLVMGICFSESFLQAA